jgi:putative lipoic acid-binding regulatory protein
MQSFGHRKPDIAYPGPWTYRIIGEDEARMRAAVVEVVGVVDYTLELSNQSSGGRYRSLELELVVVDEAHRLAVFDALKNHADIRFVF